MELTRLDAMQAAVYAEAINGDTGAPAPASSAFVQCFPKDLLGFWLVQPFATIEEKACLVSNQGISGNFVPILGELAKTCGRSQPR